MPNPKISISTPTVSTPTVDTALVRARQDACDVAALWPHGSLGPGAWCAQTTIFQINGDKAVL
jgi:hypothetical protein